jgi:hypothetical protein
MNIPVQDLPAFVRALETPASLNGSPLKWIRLWKLTEISTRVVKAAVLPCCLKSQRVPLPCGH